MIRNAHYVHSNLVARDSRALARFYQDVFGCIPVPPERDFRAAEVEAGTGVPGAGLRGLHLRLPGGGDSGPTLEIVQYSEFCDVQEPAANQLGFGHIAFAVDSIGEARAEVLSVGGCAVGEIKSTTTSDGSTVTWCYVRDPEGNIVELQANS